MGDLPIRTNSTLPLVWVDRMNLVLRTAPDLGMLRFFAFVPPPDNELVECVRLQTSRDHLRAIVDVLCRSLDYYPTKPGN